MMKSKITNLRITINIPITSIVIAIFSNDLNIVSISERFLLLIANI